MRRSLDMPLVRLPIETERLLIRALRIEDADALHELFSDAAAMRFLGSALPQSLDESQEWVQSKIERFQRDDGMSLWAIVARDTGDVVGDVGLQWEDLEGERVADLGCRLIPRYWGRGYAAEASRAVLSAGFRDLDVDRIWATTHLDNAPARRLLERLGGQFEREVHASGVDMALYWFSRAP